jgi:succinyl-CoA synthetase beta subunit
MNLHEYQAKELLKKYNVPVQEGVAVETVDAAVAAYHKIANETNNKFAVVKAQIHAGGRGKAGGVKVVKSIDDVKEKASQILGMNLITHQTGPEGRIVKRLYIEAGSNIKKEYYLSAVVDPGRSDSCLRVIRVGDQ